MKFISMEPEGPNTVTDLGEVKRVILATWSYMEQHGAVTKNLVQCF